MSIKKSKASLYELQWKIHKTKHVSIEKRQQSLKTVRVYEPMPEVLVHLEVTSLLCSRHEYFLFYL